MHDILSSTVLCHRYYVTDDTETRARRSANLQHFIDVVLKVHCQHTEKCLLLTYPRTMSAVNYYLMLYRTAGFQSSCLSQFCAFVFDVSKNRYT